MKLQNPVMQMKWGVHGYDFSTERLTEELALMLIDVTFWKAQSLTR